MTTDRARILVVDDREENLVALAAVLEPLGHEVVCASSGGAALKQLLGGDFACILLDVQMPELDGFELATLIKQRQRSQHIPIIFVTALSKDERHVFRGYSAGAVDYIFKPIDPDVLRSKVSVFVELWEKTQQLQEQAEQLHEQRLQALAQESDERYRQLADAMPQIVWTADVEGNTTYLNRRWFDYTGTTAEDGGPTAWLGAVHPDDLAATVAKREQTLASGEPFEAEYRFRAGDGSYRWHLGRSVPVYGEAGAIEYWIGTATDIHDRRLAEERQSFISAAGDALSGSLDYRRTLARVAVLAVGDVADWCSVHIVEPDGEIRELETAHVDPEKILFVRELQERYPPRDDRPTGVAAVIRTGEPELVPEITEEMLVAGANDELHLDLLRNLGMHSYMCVPLRSRDRILGAITFISSDPGRTFGAQDLMLAEEIARRATTAIENAQLYRAAEERAQAARVLATIGDGVVLVDGSGRIRLWNDAAERITGLAASGVLGRAVTTAIPGWGTVEERVQVALAGEPARAESVPLEFGSRELWLSVSAVGYEDGTVFAFRDLTEERTLESMRQDLVATVSHELRTPLAAIYGAALTLGREDVELEEALKGKLLEVIVEEANRLSDIVNDLLLASQLDSGRLRVQIERCNPLEIARAEVTAASARLPENVALELEAPRKLPAVAADPGQLRQVLANLIDNAVKYSPEGDEVEVTARRENGAVVIAVSDNGPGIAREQQRIIFEKFGRADVAGSKPGTGLGLFIARSIAEAHGGSIDVRSRPDAGATFTLTLPLAR